MDPISFASAILGAADICLKIGKYVVKTYKTYEGAEKEIWELILRMESHWFQLEIELNFLKQVHQSLPIELVTNLCMIIQLLESKLSKVNSKLYALLGTVPDVDSGSLVSVNDVLNAKGTVKKAWFALKVKKGLEEAYAGIESWHSNRLQPVLVLIAHIHSQSIDQQLNKASRSSVVSTIKELRNSLNKTTVSASVVVSADTLGPTRVDIPFSQCQRGWLQQNNKRVIINTVDFQTRNIIPSIDGIQKLAEILGTVDPEIFGLLACHGVVEHHDAHQKAVKFDFIFLIPKNVLSPITLRAALLEGKLGDCSLNECFALARLLARSISFIHAAKFVHKNIRPENILLFERDGKLETIPYLVGFEEFRPIHAGTQLLGVEDWQKNLYRHPSRQGLYIEDMYTMQHDIFSLGVCLLEIGLQISFIYVNEATNDDEPNKDLDISQYMLISDGRKRAFQIKRTFQEIAKKRLPRLTGNAYTNVVLSCLTCLDQESTINPGDSPTGVGIGLEFIEKILTELDDISV